MSVIPTEEFIRSMPSAYLASFSARDAETHAKVVARRGQQLCHVELVPTESSNRALVCLVTDDRPGLLSIVTDALLAHGLSVRQAHIYCRIREDQRPEAVDFFELSAGAREDEGAIEAGLVDSFGVTLHQMLSEQTPLERDAPSAPAARGGRIRVFFDVEALSRGKYLLVVRAPDFAGLLSTVTNALYAARARVISAEVQTRDGRADDRFELLSAREEPFTDEQLGDIQIAVYEAVSKARG